MDKDSDPASPPAGAPPEDCSAVRFADPAAAVAVTPDSSGVTPERLRHEQEQSYYNDLYLLAPVGYFVVAFDSTILRVNLVGADLLGIVRANPGEHHFRSFISAPFLSDFDVYFSAALNATEPMQCLLQMQRAGGEAFQVKLLASADGSGQACRVVLERAEGKLAALERSEERFRRIVHSAEEGIWEIDALSCTSFVNPRMAAMLGYSIEEMLGRPLAGFLDPEGQAILEQHMARREDGSAEPRDFKLLHKQGHALWTTLATNPIFDAAGRYLGALALVTDTSAMRQPNEASWQQASFDALTRLPNRHMFMDRLRQEMRKADRNDSFLALLLIGLDQFKDVNERLGQAKGDQVLIEAARRLASCVRGTDMLARLEGDEFTVILAGLDHVGSVERVARSMIALLALPFDLNGEKACLSASIGIALYPADGKEPGQLLGHADQAKDVSRQGGRGRFAYSTPALQEAAVARQTIAADLRTAIDAGQFEILYQPIVSLQTGAVHKAEALLRWRHPSRGLLAPAEFIPFAECSGLIVEIGDWVFREAAQQVQRWQALINRSFQISVNKSPLQFRRDGESYDSWVGYLAQLGLAPQSIVIEITESVLMDGVEQVIERLRQYRAMGLQVSLDDFGTGYASLSHLKRFDMDYVKIDQSFVATLEDDAGDLALCEAIIVMAHKLGLKVVAEGVETKVQRALLIDAGCDYAQGYVFAKPMTAAEFEAMATAKMPKLPH